MTDSMFHIRLVVFLQEGHPTVTVCFSKSYMTITQIVTDQLEHALQHLFSSTAMKENMTDMVNFLTCKLVKPGNTSNGNLDATR